MDNQFLLQRIGSLPEKAKEETLLFIEFLINKYQIVSESKHLEPNGKRIFGISKDDYKMLSDFDDDIDDFKTYMPE